jgi:3-hydroxybutyryl-CoA dehydratase
MNPSSPAQSDPLVGSSLPMITRMVDQATIDAYAQASGDFNPIHVDPDFARTGPFGRTIAHGLMTLAYVAELLNDWSDGAFDVAGEIDITFIGPVFAGDVVNLRGEIVERLAYEGRDCLRIRLDVRVGDRAILAGHAVQPINHPGQ